MPDTDLSKAQRDSAYHLGATLARQFDAATFAGMRVDAASNWRRDGGAGWLFMGEVLSVAWAHAQSAEDRAADVPPLPGTGPIPPCPRPVLHHVNGYTPDGEGRAYGAVVCAIDACGAHASQYRDRLAAEFGTGFAYGPQPPGPAGRVCGRRIDYRTNQVTVPTTDHDKES